jgi:hypothetical protein
MPILFFLFHDLTKLERGGHGISFCGPAFVEIASNGFVVVAPSSLLLWCDTAFHFFMSMYILVDEDMQETKTRPF